MPSLQQVQDALNTVGISAFGLAMPVISPTWTSSDLPTVNENNMSLTLAAGTWRAPAAAIARKIEDSRVGTTLVRADGSLLTGPGMLLTLLTQVYLRLSRLYAQVIERGARAESDQGLPFRPVPQYFFFGGAVDASDVSGNINPEADLDQAGEMTMYDINGMPIDPLAVAAAFQMLMTEHNILQKRSLGSPFESNSQIKQIADLAGTTATVRVRLSDHAGSPYSGDHLNGITAVNATTGLFTLNASTGSGSDLSGKITKQVATGATGAFPDEAHRLLLLGPATTGRLTDEFDPPDLPSGVTAPNRDFFSVRVVELKSFLLGNPNSSFNGTLAESRPPVRINEPLNLLADGNDVLAAASAALSGTTQESLAVAQAIKGDFETPSSTGANAHWPGFPVLTGLTPAPSGALAVSLRNTFNPSAAYFDDGNTATANVDVVLTLENLPVGAAIRVFPRKFVADAREERGDGAGGTVDASGTLVLLLKDPFTLRRPGLPESAISIPSQPTLRCDVMIVKRSGESRLYGNVETRVNAPTTSGPAGPGTNLFGTAARRGISNAGILGLGSHSLPSVTGLDPLQALLQVVLALTGEINPRDASRLPTMARRDLLIAGLSSNNWRSVIAGGRLFEEVHSADSRRGAPGGKGGRETQVVGASTQNGRIAFDVARMAFRRTTNIVTRMTELADDKWNEPTQPAAVAIGSPSTANAGTFTGAVLQTIAPSCETPELSLLKSLVDDNLSSIPATFDQFVDWFVGLVNDVASRFPGNTFVNRIQTEIVTALNNLKDNSTLNESTRERLFDEIHRELMSSCYGRRDTQWALAGAISKARHFIYIETPGFASTQKDYGTAAVPPYAADLLQLTGSRLNQATGLHVIICTPKFPDFAPGYEPMAAQETADRAARILALPPERVVAFHPIGFPGRPSRLESTVVIVDDVWGLVGSSTFRRRGLTLDGSSDLVFTEGDLVSGRVASIAKFRRQLMAARLGVPASETNAFGTMPDPNFIRLGNGIEAFYAIREILVAGGLGKIDRLWKGRTPGAPHISPTSMALANPEGLEFDLLGTLAITAIADLNSF
jgi:hypothetical protein